MKLIIDIPEWKYRSICEGIEASKRCGVVGIDPDVHEAIYKGKPYEETQGEWRLEPTRFEGVVTYICNECKALNDLPTHFCPNCGAKMQKGGAK